MSQSQPPGAKALEQAGRMLACDHLRAITTLRIRGALLQINTQHVQPIEEVRQKLAALYQGKERLGRRGEDLRPFARFKPLQEAALIAAASAPTSRTTTVGGRSSPGVPPSNPLVCGSRLSTPAARVRLRPLVPRGAHSAESPAGRATCRATTPAWSPQPPRREIHIESTAGAGLAPDANSAVVPRYDGMHDGEPEAGGLGGRLRGEKRVEHPTPRRFVHPGAAVGDTDRRVAASPEIGLQPGPPLCSRRAVPR